MSRTTRTFAYQGNVWPVVEQQARQTGFRVIETAETTRLYEKSKGILAHPTRLQLQVTNTHEVHLQAWVHVNLFWRAMALFLVPAEMELESGGVRLVFARKIGREAVNQLLSALDQEPIST